MQDSETNSEITFCSNLSENCSDVFDNSQAENIPEAQGMSNISESNSIIHMPPSCNYIQASLPEEGWFKKKGLNIVHLNIHYLYSKLDELKICLSQQSNI